MRSTADRLSAEAFGTPPATSSPLASTSFREADDALRRAIQSGAPLVLLSGLDGVGKTTLAEALAASLGRQNWRVARLAAADAGEVLRLSAAQMVLDACAAAGIAAPRCLADADDGRAGRRRLGFGRARPLCVFVDDADLLDDAVLADLAAIGRQIALEPPGGCVFVVGTLLLGDRLRRLAAAAGTEVAETVLLPLPASEIEAYLHHRLAQAGASDLRLFTFDAVAQIAAHSRGIPAHINRLCLTVLEHTRLGRGQRIGGVTIDEAAATGRPGAQAMVDDSGAFHIVALDSLEPPAAEDDADPVTVMPPAAAAAVAAPPLPPAAVRPPVVVDAELVDGGRLQAQPLDASSAVHRRMAAAAPVAAPPAARATTAVTEGSAAQSARHWLRPALAGAAAAVLAIDLGLVLLYGLAGGRLEALGGRIAATLSSLVGGDAAPGATAAPAPARRPGA